jgi:hypothetical protein
MEMQSIITVASVFGDISVLRPSVAVFKMCESALLKDRVAWRMNGTSYWSDDVLS